MNLGPGIPKQRLGFIIGILKCAFIKLLIIYLAPSWSGIFIGSLFGIEATTIDPFLK